MNPKVFLLEPCKFDVGPAGKHGPLVYIFPPNAHRNSVFRSEFRNELVAKLAELHYMPGRDYFVATGAIGPVSITLATMLAAFGKVKLLVWSGTENLYLPMEFSSNAPNSATDTCDDQNSARANLQPVSGVAPVFGAMPESRRAS